MRRVDGDERVVPENSRGKPMIGKLRRIHGIVSAVVLNTLLLFVLLNVAAWFVLAAWRMSGGKLIERSEGYGFQQVDFNPIFYNYGKARTLKAYPGWQGEEVSHLLDETYVHRRIEFEPYTAFRESAFLGKYVNVDERGFRRFREQGPWPPDKEHFNVFVFGGSTTFGYGVQDADAIPARLQFRLDGLPLIRKPRIYNFARASYTSTQERILFEQLLLGGTAPDLAVFVDGLNDFYFSDGNPLFSDILSQLFRDGHYSPDGFWRPLAVRFPLLKAADAILNYWRIESVFRKGKHQPGVEDESRWKEDEGLSSRIVARYAGNMKMIEAVARERGVATLFVWQPLPTYKYDLSNHLFYDGFLGSFLKTKYGYPVVRQWAESVQPENFSWAGDLLEGRKENLFVDLIHYNPKLCDLVAGHIADALVRKGLLPFRR